jgi:hypothetical protein
MFLSFFCDIDKTNRFADMLRHRVSRLVSIIFL